MNLIPNRYQEAEALDRAADWLDAEARALRRRGGIGVGIETAAGYLRARAQNLRENRDPDLPIFTPEQQERAERER